MPRKNLSKYNRKLRDKIQKTNYYSIKKLEKKLKIEYENEKIKKEKNQT